MCKNEKVLFYFNRLAISWPPWVRVWGWASYRLLPFTGFSLGLPFCFSSYIIHLQCTSEGVVSVFNETAHSFFVWGIRERLLPCSVVVTAKWVVSCTDMDYMYLDFVPLFADITCPLFLFRKCSCCFLSFPLLFHHAFFLFYLWFIGHFVPAC